MTEYIAGKLGPPHPQTRPPTTGGEPCPFRPEKYFEAVTYAGLPVEQRWAVGGWGCQVPRCFCREGKDC